jgi:CHASE2 domain-containing sensor protein
MYLLDTLGMSLMKPRKLLQTSNTSMVVFLLLSIVVFYLAWFQEENLPLMLLVFLHLSQVILAGLFKVAYVFRLIAQNQLGEELR